MNMLYFFGHVKHGYLNFNVAIKIRIFCVRNYKITKYLLITKYDWGKSYDIEIFHA